MYTLKVTVERIDGYCNQPMMVGDYFTVEGGKLKIPAGKHVCIWALQSMMPISLSCSAGIARRATGKARKPRYLFALIRRGAFTTGLKG
jgi:uncharacterized repeat protein (TIGR04076 family)